MRRSITVAVGVLLFCAVVIHLQATTITVTNTNDGGPGSLRQALAVADDGDRITFAVSGVIRLTSGGLVVVRNITISGPGANQLSIDGNQAEFVFGVIPHRTVSISGLSITNGQYGIWNQQGTLSVSNCVLSGNSSAGLYNDASEASTGASMTVANSIISNNSGTGALNARALPNPLGASITSGRNSAKQSSPDGLCACLTITDSVLSNNAGHGIFNIVLNWFGNVGASLTVVNSDISDNEGSGISNDATEGGASATIVSTTVSGNLAGGIFTSVGVFAATVVTVTDSIISGNSAYGGIRGGSVVTVTNSTITGNSAADTGGGIYGAGVSLVNSTISGNSAGTSGGGIYGHLGVSVVNSTISGNSAGTSGGAIYNVVSFLDVANSTITGNSAPSGGGIYNDGDDLVEISNTILNAGASGENIFNSGGTITSLGYNLSSDDGGGYLTGPGDQINTDPLLGPLQDNGGPTFTHALLPGSPAIDAGDPSFSPPPVNDQRGCPFDRVFNGRIDIGSLEVQPPRRPCPTPRPRPTPVPRPTPR
jgi:predicted outer membrane repeat protein